MDLSELERLEAKTNTTADVLRRAKELIANPERWTQGELENSGRYCAEGALMVASQRRHPDGNKPWRFLCKAATEGWGATSRPCDVNDRYGHAAALAMFDRAIQLAEQE